MREPIQRFDIAAHKLWSKCLIGNDVYISDMARVRGKLNQIKIGNDCAIADFVVLMAENELHLGARVKLNFGAKVLAHEKVKICADVIIGCDVKIISGYKDLNGINYGSIEIGTGSIILPGAVILAGAKIPAGKLIRANEVVNG